MTTTYDDGRFSTQLTSSNFDVYDTIAAGVSATSEGTLGVTRAIRCGAAGVLVVNRAADGVAVPLPFAAGEIQPVQAIGLESEGATGCAPITVYR